MERIFHGEKLLWHGSVWTSEAVRSTAAVALMPLLIFCCVHRSCNSQMLCNGPDNPQQLPLRFGHLDPHLTHYSLDQPESTLQSATRSVVAGLTNLTNRQTHTDHATLSVAMGRIQLLMRSGLISKCWLSLTERPVLAVTSAWVHQVYVGRLAEYPAETKYTFYPHLTHNSLGQLLRVKKIQDPCNFVAQRHKHCFNSSTFLYT